jgi:hypothetical protein
LSLYAGSGFVREKQYNRRVEAFFGTLDANSCQRVAQALLRMSM